jgi:hypothetical protein
LAQKTSATRFSLSTVQFIVVWAFVLMGAARNSARTVEPRKNSFIMPSTKQNCVGILPKKAQRKQMILRKERQVIWKALPDCEPEIAHRRRRRYARRALFTVDAPLLRPRFLGTSEAKAIAKST